MSKVAITPDMTVEELVGRYPVAVRFLMQRGIACMR